MKSIAANAFLATLSIALTLAAVEVGLRVAGYPPALTDHSEFMRRDPALGWALRPGVRGTYVSDEYAHDVRVNSRGMRGPEPAAGAGDVRIVLLGDSFVEGYSVAEEERVSEALEARLRAVGGCEVRVVPMGTAGYSTDQQLIWLERDGLSMEPHAVVLMFYFNDVWYNGRETYFGAEKPYFRLRADSLVGPFLPLADPPAAAGGTARDVDEGENGATRRRARSGEGGLSGMRLYRLAERTAKNSDFLRSAAIRLGLADPPPEARIAAVGPDGLPTELQVFVSRESEEVVRAWEITARLIRRMADLTASAGAEFTIFLVPFRGRVHPDAETPLAGAVDLSAVADRLAGLCARHGLDCMDPAPDFRRAARDEGGEGARLYYHMDTHWTAAGHAVAADLLAARLGDSVRDWCAHARGEAA